MLSKILDPLLFAMRVFMPFLAMVILYQGFSSMRNQRRGGHPLIMLWNNITKKAVPVIYWENSIGRGRSSDIVLKNDPTVSRDHAVLFRRAEGWLISDTGSRGGTFLNGEKIEQPETVHVGDVIRIGGTSLTLKKRESVENRKQSWFFNDGKAARTIKPAGLLCLITFFHFLMALGPALRSEKITLDLVLPFIFVTVISWTFLGITKIFINRTTFELESLAIFLSGTGVLIIANDDVRQAYVQIGAMTLGMFVFCLIIWFIEDLNRVSRYRMIIAIASVLLFIVNLAIGKEINGSKNWIIVGPVSIQLSEIIKISFIFVGAATLDHLQTTKNLTGFILFSTLCMGSLFLMRDFGTACIFFVTFLIISFMRSGSIRTLVLACSAAAIGAVMILKFKPYVAERFAVWGHAWEYAQEGGYQQTNVLISAASGGLFGMGVGLGNLKNIFAGTSDLMFGLLVEEMGLASAVIMALFIASFALYARTSSSLSRSTFYSMTACASAGLLVFQSCLNIFGATDILPMTGVTLPFVSLGGSSMVSAWGLLAFIKASDERTYAAKRK